MTDGLLWPRYADPADLAVIEAVPLADRRLPASTYELLTRAAQRWPHRVALSVLPDADRFEQPTERTFAQLLADVHRYANLLHRLGVRRGDAVGLLAPNCAELVAATLAAQLAGIAAPINSALSPDQVSALLRRCGARVLITVGPELAPGTWAGVRALARGLKAVLVLRPTGARGAPPALSAPHGVRAGYLAQSAAAESALAFAGTVPGPGDLAAFLHTGGTTGMPKLAAHTHGAQVANAWMIAAISVFDAQCTLLAALPLFHVNALGVTLLAPLFKGQRVLWAGPGGYRDPLLYPRLWRIIERYRIVALSAVPTVYAALTRYPVDAEISSLRYALVGAAPLPPATRAAFEHHTGARFLEGYGLTEATCASARSFPHAPRPGSVGQRMPYQHVRILHPVTRQQMPTGHSGVLAISGPTVFAGYVLEHTEHSHRLDASGALVDGWLDTGDLAHLDTDGFIYLTGRVKDLIIRGGHNIDPALIEDALLTHPQVTAAAAVGRPDAHAGEVPVAYVTVTAGATASESELLAWAAGHVPEPAAAPKTITVLDDLPVTALGKPSKLPLRADAARRALTDALKQACPHTSDAVTVQTTIEDGRVVALVSILRGIDLETVTAVFDRYPVAWRVTPAPRSGPPA